MKFEVRHAGAFASLEVTMSAGEAVHAESDAMVASSSQVTVEGTMQGGLFGGISRSFLTGETLFLQVLISRTH